MRASITFTQHGSGCSSLVEHSWNDRASSVNTHGSCILAWEHSDCSGTSHRISPSSHHHNHLSALGFNDEISSFQLCPQGGGSSLSDELSGVQRVAVDEHNKYRRRHGSPDIRGDDQELHRVAQHFADHLARNNLFDHSGNSKYGENLGAGGGPTKEEAVRSVIERWYDEEKTYDYNNPGSSGGHFTAVVWKATTHVGIGVAWNPRANWYVVVANYKPPGNFGGQYRENVLRPQ
ncbi:Golgi-associated plant pathogenesis-related protein 1 [Orchesella cincta]|uniref:Golgi-associated plant pathogenesis-related protein 1 n=1 Tax=Orchesella cincta TaxID=48709 RepID=A0A1D2MZB3_ORCCI|nr:Golgi-associated plant pathogenesis-related protein 1 [Orchesella cincta]